jgi:hypothetical protein
MELTAAYEPMKRSLVVAESLGFASEEDAVSSTEREEVRVHAPTVADITAQRQAQLDGLWTTGPLVRSVGESGAEGPRLKGDAVGRTFGR